MNFSDQEKEVIHHFASRKNVNDELFHTIAVLSPIIVFGVWGIYKKDIMLISMSWSGFILYLIWHTATTLKYFPAYKSLFNKLKDMETDSKKSDG